MDEISLSTEENQPWMQQKRPLTPDCLDTPRQYYHAGREPKILLAFSSSLSRGMLVSHWKSGVEVQLYNDQPDLGGAELVSLYLSELEDSFALTRMRVAGAQNQQNAPALIRLEVSDPADCVQLNELISRLKKPQKRSQNAPSVTPRRIPGSSIKSHYAEKAIRERIQWAELTSGGQIDKLAQSVLDPPTLAGNIENYIGAVQIPVGLAGPVRVRGTYTDDFVPVPIATTEGALISSVTRGAMACNLAGGIEVHVHDQRMTRAPAFICEDMQGALNLERWIQQNKAPIIRHAESASSIARVKSVETHVFHNMVHVVFSYSTGDASGQNMTTSCTWFAAEWIQEQVRHVPAFRYRRFYIELNMSSDKKLSSQNLSGKRGVSVTASCLIPDTVMRRVLHISAAELHETYNMAEVGSVSAGSISQNINFANVIAGVFTATGQDIACVHESAGGFLKLYLENGGLRCIAHLPGLVIGTVGGGTGLPTQKECLDIMGCHGKGKLFRLAEIIASTCLALDISTGSAIVSHHFVKAHERLGRNRPKALLTPRELEPNFFTSLMKDTGKSVLESEKIDLEHNSGILNDLRTNDDHKKVVGIHRYRLKVSDSTSSEYCTAVLKLKNSGNDLLDYGEQISKLSGNDRLSGLFASQSSAFNIEDCHLREIYLYRRASPQLLAFCPEVLGSRIDHEREVYALLLEDLSGNSHLDTVNRARLWSNQDIRTVLRDMASLHSIYFRRDSEETAKQMTVRTLDTKTILDSQPLLLELTRHNAASFPWMTHAAITERMLHFLEYPQSVAAVSDSYPRTLVHGDFNPRNLCLRPISEKTRRLVIYDWELACFANPQRDLIEFLAFVCDEDTPEDVFFDHVEHYRGHLEEATREILDPDDFFHILYVNGLIFAVTRLNLYHLGQNIFKFEFIERVFRNLDRFTSALFNRRKSVSASK